MYGKNPVRKPWIDESGRLAVQSVFPTIQGEGPNAGQPAVFVRLAGCNLRCWFCDTDFESNIDQVLSVDALIQRVRDAAPSRIVPLVVLTGGEPLRQNVLPLIEALNACGYRVQIETAGTIWRSGLTRLLLDGTVEMVCSPKTPRLDLNVALWCKDYKYIVDAQDDLCAVDGLPIAATQRGSKPAKLARPAPNSSSRIWLQPCDRGSAVLNAANVDLCVMLAMKYGYRLSLQLHKILGVE